MFFVFPIRCIVAAVIDCSTAGNDPLDHCGSISGGILEIGQPVVSPFGTNVAEAEIGWLIGLALIVAQGETNGMTYGGCIAERGVGDIQAHQHGMNVVACHSNRFCSVARCFGLVLIARGRPILITAGGIALSIDHFSLCQLYRLPVSGSAGGHQKITTGLRIDGLFREPKVLAEGGILYMIKIAFLFHDGCIMIHLPVNHGRYRDLSPDHRAVIHASLMG